MIRISTPRLLLLPMHPDDVAAFEFLLSIEDIRDEFSAMAGCDREKLAANMRVRLHDPEYRPHPWLWIVNKTTQQIVGFMMVRDYRVPITGKQLYYALHPGSRGRGFAAEALGGLTNYFLEKEQVSLVFVRGEILNESSFRTMVAAGFRPFDLPMFPDKFLGYAGQFDVETAAPLIFNFVMQPSPS